MSVRINLKNHPSEDFYTNFDLIQGDVVLNLNSSESVISVVVKVEGLAKSLCYTEPGNGKTRSKTPVQEVHKVLYLTESVFPDEQLRRTSTATSFTLPPGKHTWPFKFQIPVNNECKEDNSIKSSPLGSLLLGPTSAQKHVQQILPPSMSGSEEVWVRYFVKATVMRPSILSINHRTFAPFIFLPIEAPRAEQPDSSQAFFVKRQHTLSTTTTADESRRLSLKGRFRDKGSKSGDTIAIEVRMPNPPSLVPGLPVNMDIMGFIETNYNLNDLMIVKVVIHLCSVTKVRAGGLKRSLMSRTPSYTHDFNVALRPQDNPEQPAVVIPLVQAAPFILATDTPPTFSTCNIARIYSLEIAVTVQQQRTRERETVVLNCPVTILSGVQAPPPQMPQRSNPVSDEKSSGPSGSQKPPSPPTDLPTYTEAVEVGAPSSRPRVPIMTSRTAMRTRTSYRVGQDYYQTPEEQ